MYGNRLVATSAHFPAIEIDVHVDFVVGTRRELPKYFGSNAKGSEAAIDRTAAITVPPAAALAAASSPGTAQRPRARRVRRLTSHAHECPRHSHQPPPVRVAKPSSADHVAPRFPDVQNRSRSGFPTRRAAVGRHVCSAHGGGTSRSQ